MEIIITGSLLIAFLVFVVIDVYYAFRIWLSRIRIGRVGHIDTYMDHISGLSEKWMEHTPTVRPTDNTRLILLDILKGNFKKDSIQFWQKAGLLLGLLDIKKTAAYTNLLDTESSRSIPREADYVIYSYALLKMAVSLNKVQEYESYFHRVYQMILELKGTDTSVKYKEYTGHYRFVDTLGFICPYLLLYGQVLERREACNLAVEQLEEFNARGLFGDACIPVHAYHYQTHMPLGLYGWARGMGWYAIALADMRDLIDQNDPHYEIISQSIKSFARAVIHCQRADGSWGWQVFVKELPADTSATIMLSWLLIVAADMPDIAVECRQAVHKSVRYIMSVTRRNGAIDFCQGDTKAIGVYSNVFDVLPFAQGYALRVLSRVQKSKHEYGFQD